MTDREKDVEILALRHQLAVLHRQLGDQRPRLRPEDRALLAALLGPVARATLRRIQLLVSPDTVLRWHRDLMKRRQVLSIGVKNFRGELLDRRLIWNQIGLWCAVSASDTTTNTAPAGHSLARRP